MARNFRTVYRWLVPGWLLEGDGTLVLESLAAIKDACVERVRQGLNARFPSRTGASAQALIGRDRGIVRGRDETNGHYAQRLIRWRYPRGHRVRGNAFALLEQFSEYFGGVDGYTIDYRGNRYDRTADGTETASQGIAWEWYAVDFDEGENRFWVVLDLSEIASEQLDFGDSELWGGALATPGYTIGQQGVTEQDVLVLRNMMHSRRAWKPAGTRAEWVIVSLDGTDPEPDETWQHWSQNVGGTQTETRSSAHRYWSLTPTANNYYSGNSDSFCEEFPLLGGAGMYAGDPDNFPASLTLPDGTEYAGDPDSFTTLFLLVDDGDLPQ